MTRAPPTFASSPSPRCRPRRRSRTSCRRRRSWTSSTPVALVAGAVAGAIAGKKSARKVEVGFSQEKLRKLDECLPAGGSALVLVVEHRWFNTLQVELADTGGQLIHECLTDDSYDDLVKSWKTSSQAPEEHPSSGNSGESMPFLPPPWDVCYLNLQARAGRIDCRAHLP